MWFKAHVARDGSIISCEMVAERGTDRGQIVYVDARDKAEACKLAKAAAESWWKNGANEDVRALQANLKLPML